MTTTLRERANEIKPHVCKSLICVLENPKDIKNIGSVIRNVSALGVSKTYVIDERGILPDDWQKMRTNRTLNCVSVSAVKWSFVKVFRSTTECIEHLNKKDYTSIVTSPHIKGRNNAVLHDGDYTQKRLAVWFGNESRGISQEAVEASSLCVQIPMYGIIESLNLGTSTGIVLYEVTKQRRKFLEERTTWRRNE
jgi:tRNA (guanosine-2'-O-)-methyltransferase